MKWNKRKTIPGVGPIYDLEPVQFTKDKKAAGAVTCGSHGTHVIIQMWVSEHDMESIDYNASAYTDYYHVQAAKVRVEDTIKLLRWAVDGVDPNSWN